MRIYLRVETPRLGDHPHCTVRVFINGASCGLLTLRTEEFDELFVQLRNGAVNWEDVRATGDGLDPALTGREEP